MNQFVINIHASQSKDVILLPYTWKYSTNHDIIIKHAREQMSGVTAP